MYDLGINPKQKELVMACFGPKQYDVIYYGGAAGGGKSFGACMVVDMYSLMIPNSFCVFFRKSLASMKNTTIKSYKKALSVNWGNEWHKEITFNKSESEFHYPNGSVVKFIGENDAADKDKNFMNGLEINVAVLEECDELTKDLFDKALIRAGRNFNGGRKLVICTSNPNQQWPKKTFYEASVKGTLPKKWKYIQALLSDNGAADADYVAGMTQENLTEKMYRRMILGDWTDFDIENRWAYMYDEDKHSASNEQRRAAGLCDIVIDDKTQQAVSLDFNVDIMAGIVAQINRQKKQLWIHKEFSPCLGLEERIESIKSDEFTKKCLSRLIVTGDASDGRSAKAPNVSFYQDLQKGLRLSPLQLQVGKVNPEHPDSRNEMESVFHKWDVWISPDCAELIADLKFAQVKIMNGGKTSLIDKAKRDPHRLDCFRYLVHNLIAKAGLL